MISHQLNSNELFLSTMVEGVLLGDGGGRGGEVGGGEEGVEARQPQIESCLNCYSTHNTRNYYLCAYTYTLYMYIVH